MLNSNDFHSRQRWQAFDQLVARWLDERQELLVRFCTISRLRPLSETASRHQNDFHRFCEVLVDYVSAGHFEVYEQLLQEAASFQDGGTELARELYPVIARTTETVLDFNDQFLESGATSKLAQGLSRLGKALEARFDMEDRLIDSLHRVHANKVA